MSTMSGGGAIAVLDFGSQYSQLIARRIRENQVYSKIVPFNITPEELKKENVKGIILSGGPSNVYAKNAPLCDKGIFELGIPVLGICFGMQLIGHLLGGKVAKSTRREFGRAELVLDDTCDLFKGLSDDTITVWMSHGDKVDELPPNFTVMGHTDNAPIAALADHERKIYGLQFHPEVVHTPRGNEIIRNFVVGICGMDPNWTMESYIEREVREIRKKVGKSRVVCGLSGGVDSSVAAVLIHKAIGDQLTCIFVNNGLLRKGEAEKVQTTFSKHFGIDLRYADEEDRFLEKLKGVEDPEKKRKIIGNEFIRVFEEETKKIGDAEFLAQGTLYPDVIESVSAKGGPSATIKTHHNVGGLPEDMKFKLLEPFRDLFKDEVREVGAQLGMPDEIIWRQPFPGPGLAIRIISDVTKENLDLLREADAIVLDEVKKAGLYRHIWQSFAVLLPIKSVGVMGDERTYEKVVALRAVNSIDGMTADWVQLPYDLLGRISNRIINEVTGINRVVYDISSKPPSTIEWE